MSSDGVSRQCIHAVPHLDDSKNKALRAQQWIQAPTQAIVTSDFGLSNLSAD